MSLKLSDDERERLTTLAAARKRSCHYLMREAVRECLTREELRQAFADDAEKAWLDDERTGLHVTHAEIDAWALAVRHMGEAGYAEEPPSTLPRRARSSRRRRS